MATGTPVLLSGRDKYGEVLVELGRENPNIVVIGGDLNKSVMTLAFARAYPERFFDCGIAEQNMMNIAAGLASSGKIPFVSTFAVFGTARDLDQIRVGIAQPNLNVKIVLTHAGIVTGEDGISAQSIEDLGLMCAFPTFNVVAPADAIEAAQAVRLAAYTRGPFYIRLYRPATPVVSPADYKFVLGKAATLREGKDVTVIACGNMVIAALDAAANLAKTGIQCRILNMATLQPADKDAIVKAASETGAIVTAEEHLRQGGLGSIVAQIVTENHPVPMGFVAMPNRYAESGKPNELLEKYGLTAADVERVVRSVLQRK